MHGRGARHHDAHRYISHLPIPAVAHQCMVLNVVQLITICVGMVFVLSSALQHVKAQLWRYWGREPLLYGGTSRSPTGPSLKTGVRMNTLRSAWTYPGVQRGSRWTDAGGGDGYFVMYELQAYETLVAPAYLARLNEPSPSSAKMMPHHRNMVRSQCRVLESCGGALSAVCTDGAAAPVRRSTRFSSPAATTALRLKRWQMPNCQTARRRIGCNWRPGRVVPAVVSQYGAGRGLRRSCTSCCRHKQTAPLRTLDKRNF